MRNLLMTMTVLAQLLTISVYAQEFEDQIISDEAPVELPIDAQPLPIEHKLIQCEIKIESAPLRVVVLRSDMYSSQHISLSPTVSFSRRLNTQVTISNLPASNAEPSGKLTVKVRRSGSYTGRAQEDFVSNLPLEALNLTSKTLTSEVEVNCNKHVVAPPSSESKMLVCKGQFGFGSSELSQIDFSRSMSTIESQQDINITANGELKIKIDKSKGKIFYSSLEPADSDLAFQSSSEYSLNGKSKYTYAEASNRAAVECELK